MNTHSGVLDRVRALAQASALEICGALLADRTGVVALVALENRSAHPHTEFFIAAADIARVERQAERSGHTLAGFYHSHPGGNAVPSARDLELAVPGYTYWIAARHEVRAWRLRDDRSGFDEVAIA